MEWLNDATKHAMQLDKDSMQIVLTLFSIVAPHMASQLLEDLLGKKLTDCSWPIFDPLLLHNDSVVIAIQVNGKLRGTLDVAMDMSQGDIESLARDKVAKWIEDKEIKKIIYVKNKMMSFVIS